MAKVILIYASMSGNTEAMADLIEEGLQSTGVEVVKKEVMDTRVDELHEYDGIILGAYTWGDGELPDEFLDFYDDMEDVDFTGKSLAVFGSGDTAYAEFCGAVDLLEQRVQESGGTLVVKGLKIELAPVGSDTDLCKSFGEQFAQAIGIKQR